MKKLMLACSVLLMSMQSLAAEKIDASNDESLQILDSVVQVHRTYSQTSGYEAKLFELLGGDGMNPTRMVLLLNTGMGGESSQVFQLGEMMYAVTRITFLAKDVIVVNYTQDSFADSEALVPIQVKKSMKITVQKDGKGQLTGSILTEDISK